MLIDEAKMRKLGFGRVVATSLRVLAWTDKEAEEERGIKEEERERDRLV